MTNYSKSENSMWDKPIKEVSLETSDAQINDKYEIGEQRIVTETNREKLPNFVEALEKPDYMQVRPFYQRRERWDDTRKSKLIESFIMNVPVPPMFLYEKDFNQYEVMDGQQRITALHSFYRGDFKLKGLEIWKELNGRNYASLPSKVRNGLDRRSISYIVVLKESTIDEDEAAFLRQTVFERLNTGGVKLEKQEIRNCIYQGPFNDLLIELSQLDEFRAAFGLPLFGPDESEPRAAIRKKVMYQKLGDAEMVLRFFALRHVEHYARGMANFLDIYMSRSRNFDKSDIEYLRNLFATTISLASQIYGELIFKTYDEEKGAWSKTAQAAFYDAVMVGLSRHTNAAHKFIEFKDVIINKTRELFSEAEEGTFTGRGNTKKDIIERINSYEDLLKAIAQ